MQALQTQQRGACLHHSRRSHLALSGGRGAHRVVLTEAWGVPQSALAGPAENKRRRRRELILEAVCRFPLNSSLIPGNMSAC